MGLRGDESREAVSGLTMVVLVGSLLLLPPRHLFISRIRAKRNASVLPHKIHVHLFHCLRMALALDWRC